MAAPKRNLPYLISTVLLSLLMLISAAMYFVQHDQIAEAFTALGYPTYLIYPLAIAKVLGLVAIWTRRSEELRGLAYAGFFYDFVLALAAHLAVGDGQFGPAAVALALLAVSYVSSRRKA